MRFAFAVATAFLVLACDLLASPGATFEQGVEHIPGPGYFHVVGDPPAAGSDIVVRWFGEDGEESGVSATIASGATIEINGVSLPGQKGLSVNGVKCEGRFPIQIDKLTEVVLRIDGDGCELTFNAVAPVGMPEQEATSSPDPSPSIDPAEIDRWIAFREAYGLRTDRSWAISVAAKVESRNDTGVPLVPWELEDIGTFIETQHELIDVLQTYGRAHPDRYESVIVDGPTTVLLMTGDITQDQAALALLLPERAPYEVRPVRWTNAELMAFAAQVKAEAAWFESVGLYLVDAGPDPRVNKVSVCILAPSDEAFGTVLAHFGNPEWMEVTREGPLPWKGPRGTLTVRVVDRAGRPVENLICEPVPIDESVDANSYPGCGEIAPGVYRYVDLPATEYNVKMYRLRNRKQLIYGTGRVVVPPDSRVRLRIVAERP